MGILKAATMNYVLIIGLVLVATLHGLNAAPDGAIADRDENTLEVVDDRYYYNGHYSAEGGYWGWKYGRNPERELRKAIKNQMRHSTCNFLTSVGWLTRQLRNKRYYRGQGGLAYSDPK